MSETATQQQTLYFIRHIPSAMFYHAGTHDYAERTKLPNALCLHDLRSAKEFIQHWLSTPDYEALSVTAIYTLEPVSERSERQ
jgi:hypothetical protein